MKIVVVGPGAMGCLFYSLLRRNSGHDLFLLGRDAQRAEHLQRHGITLVQSGKAQHIPVKIACRAENIGECEAILLCVKSSAVKGCLHSLQPLFGGRSLLLAMQNGISHLQALHEATFLHGRFAIGVTSEGANITNDGTVIHAGKGKTRVGFSGLPGQNAAATLVTMVAAMNKAGLETMVVNDITTQVWNKLLVNVGINALTVLYNCPNGKLLEIEAARRKLAAAVREAEAVARAKMIPVIADPVAMVEEVCRKTAENISSMLQDVRKNRPTEVAAINGEIIREATLLGLQAPVNTELFQRVKDIETLNNL